MELESQVKNRQSVTSLKKRASNDAKRARYLAEILKVDDKILRKIDTLEQKIQNATLSRNNAKNFCQKEIKQLQLILSDLEKRYTRKTRRYELAFSLVVLIGNLVVFWGYYISSIPKGADRTNPNFYLILGIITYTLLVGFFFFYFRAYRWLTLNIFLPFLSRINTSTSKRYLKFYNIVSVMATGSLCTFIYRLLVLAFATTVPQFFSPSMSFLVLLSNIWLAFVQFFFSEPLVAIATFLTIVAFVVSPLKKLFKSMLN